ncbi:hypothetical protein ACS2QP_27780, partial [Bacillus cereus group sp. Bce019]|uniref:hypothetical protein n=1 Tax=Bacillus cereus group sp. Bce019 TaxID=3445247 RepID=UPI003F236B4E
MNRVPTSFRIYKGNISLVISCTDPSQIITTQQNGNSLSIFYQRSNAQKNLEIKYAIWSHENGQDDLRWI